MLDKATEEAIRISFAKGPAWLRPATCLLIRAGSHAYGCNLPTSDIDLRGICIPPKSTYLGFVNGFDSFAPSNPDTEILGLHTFFRGASQGDLQALQLLFCDQTDLVLCNKVGEELRAIRKNFLSQKIIKPIAGYARGMIEKAKNAIAKKTTRDYPKDVMHAMRVTRMLREALLNGEFLVRRPDAAELVAMRLNRDEGAVMAAIAEVEKMLLEIPLWKSTTTLPKECDVPMLDALCIRMIEDSFGSNPPASSP